MMKKNNVTTLKNSKLQNGFSLIEILIVVGLFAVISVITTQVLTTSIRGSKKSESIESVRSEIDFATQQITRQLRNASSIAGGCTGVTQTAISFYDQNSIPNTFSCLDLGTENGHIASSSANIRITSTDITITACEITCYAGQANTTDNVLLKFSAKDKLKTGIESSQVDVETRVYLRNY